MNRTEREAAVVLAAGSGKRMGTEKPKQFLDLCGQPALYWTLLSFERSSVDAVIVVVSSAETGEYVRNEIVVKNGFNKVKSIVPGGAERYDSVWKGLCVVTDETVGGADYVLIHDGARCLVTPEIIERTISDAKRLGSGIASMPVKDTIKRTDENGFSAETIDRSTLRQMQTPQTFLFSEIYDAYAKLMKESPCPKVTDDAEVLERMNGKKAYLSKGSYENLKLTTPEDLIIAEAILKKRLT